tara:strand:- start:162 stop:620 length:459 start_codon:yes stop_codon:yes gene_type:complete
MLIKLFLLATFILLQSCSSTLVGEKLENSFDTIDNSTFSANNIKEQKKSNEIKNIKSIKMGTRMKKKEKDNKTQENSKFYKDSVANESSVLINNVNYNPQPYRIILKLSGANPSAPAQSVTKALIKAGVKFEVEKIERVDEKILLNNKSMKR